MVLMQASSLLALPLVHVGAAQATLTGTLSVIFADPAPGATLPVHDTRYFLQQINGVKTELVLDASVVAPFGGARPLIGAEVTATVNVPVGPMIAADAPRTVTAISLAPGARLQPRDQTVGNQLFANVLCKFADNPNEPQTPAYVQGLMGTGDPNTVASWWQTVSYSNVNINGSQTFPATGPWYVLPGNEASYLKDAKTMDEDKIATDCTKAAIAAGTNLTPFKGINFLLNDSLVSYALGGQGSVNDGATELLSARGLTWLMPWSYGQVPANPDGTRSVSGLGTMEHEMGHAFLLWHSGNINGKEYQDSWDPMGDPDVGCDPFHPPTVYGCTGQSLTAYDKDFLGWVDPARQFKYAGITPQVTLTSLMNGTTDNYLSITVPHTTATNYTVVELRTQSGIDSRVPGNGVIIHEIDTTNTNISKRITSVNGGVDAIRAVGQAYAVPGAPALVNVTVKSVTGNTAAVILSNGIAPAVTGYMGTLT